MKINSRANLPEQKLFIGGEYADADSGEHFESVNPSTNGVICRVQQGGRKRC